MDSKALRGGGRADVARECGARGVRAPQVSELDVSGAVADHEEAVAAVRDGEVVHGGGHLEERARGLREWSRLVSRASDDRESAHARAEIISETLIDRKPTSEETGNSLPRYLAKKERIVGRWRAPPPARADRT